MTSLNAEVIRQKEWLARSNIDFFKKNEAAVMADRTVLLAHNTTLRVLSRTYEAVSRDAHYITIASRIILAERVSSKIYQEEEIFKAESTINEHLERMNDYFDRRIEQAEQRLRAAGYDPGKVPYRAKAYEAKTSTRTATDYLEITKKADLYLVLQDYLWITGELADSSGEALRIKLNNEREVRNHLTSIPRKSTAQFQIIRRICAGVMDQRKLQREAQSARDKEKAKNEKAKSTPGRQAKNAAEPDPHAGDGNGVPAVATYVIAETSLPNVAADPEAAALA